MSQEDVSLYPPKTYVSRRRFFYPPKTYVSRRRFFYPPKTYVSRRRFFYLPKTYVSRLKTLLLCPQNIFLKKTFFYAPKTYFSTKSFFYVDKTYVIVDNYNRSWNGPILWIQRGPNLFRISQYLEKWNSYFQGFTVSIMLNRTLSWGFRPNPATSSRTPRIF